MLSNFAPSILPPYHVVFVLASIIGLKIVRIFCTGLNEFHTSFVKPLNACSSPSCASLLRLNTLAREVVTSDLGIFIHLPPILNKKLFDLSSTRISLYSSSSPYMKSFNRLVLIPRSTILANTNANCFCSCLVIMPSKFLTNFNAPCIRALK